MLPFYEASKTHLEILNLVFQLLERKKTLNKSWVLNISKDYVLIIMSDDLFPQSGPTGWLDVRRVYIWVLLFRTEGRIL